MSVRRSADGTIFLDGACPVEDAETLLRLLQETPAAAVDWRQCGHLHTAVLQVLLVARPPRIRPCGDPWMEQWATG